MDLTLAQLLPFLSERGHVEVELATWKAIAHGQGERIVQLEGQIAPDGEGEDGCG